jgi:hypothetical protein
MGEDRLGFSLVDSFPEDKITVAASSSCDHLPPRPLWGRGPSLGEAASAHLRFWEPSLLYALEIRTAR